MLNNLFTDTIDYSKYINKSSIDYSSKDIHINNTIDNRTIDNRYDNNSIKQKTGNKYQIDPAEADSIIHGIRHLIDDQSYAPFYYRKLYELGKDRFIELVYLAEKGENPSRLFAYLMKKAKS